jgi:hypothetical protein
MPGMAAGAEAVVSTAVDLAAGFTAAGLVASTEADLVASMAADSMPDFADFTMAGSTAIGFAITGSTAIDFAITGFSSGAIIRTTTITTIANPTPRPGITAPIRQAITPMWGSAIPAGKRFQVVDAWSRPLAEGGPLCGVRRGDAQAKTIGTRIADITRSNGPGAAILANKDGAV